MLEKTGKIKITLLSDLLVSYGNGYNSMIDQDICYDKYGFPLIPAKRIKGCLREVAMELNDWGYELSFDDLFGGEGEREGKVQISNAFLQGYDTYVSDFHQMETCLQNPQMVLDAFTYTRTQTSIDYETGIAEEGLRVSRVVGKGLTFETEIVIKANTEAELMKYEMELADCCKAFRRMGCERTRGLGEIEASFEKGELIQNGGNAKIKLNKQAKYRLDYNIHLNSALIVKSEAGGLEQTQDYLPGSVILGKIAEWLKRDANFAPNTYENFMKLGEVICSNAYIAHEGKRMMPNPASLFVIKNKETEGIDLTCLKEEKSDVPYQMKSLGTCYIDGVQKEIKKKKVLLDINYHHSRPSDKSVGRVLQNNAESQLYQLASICAGQDFAGFVIANGEQMEKIYTLFQKYGKCRLGYNRTAEYGEVVINTKQPKEIGTAKQQLEKQFVVKLESPLMEYDEQGRYTTDVKVLTTELEQVLGKSLQPIRTFYRYQSTGGYNRTWHMRKPTIDVWNKGTTIVYEANEKVNVSLLENCFLGERVSEGYGEVSVYPVSTVREKKIVEIEEIEQTSQIKNSPIREKLLTVFGEKFVIGEARKEAKEEKTKDVSLINCMISMCKEHTVGNLRQYLKREIDARYGEKSYAHKQNKYEDAQKIIQKLDVSALKEKFKSEYKIDLDFREEAFAKCYYSTYLTEVKYQLRGKKGVEHE